MKEYFEMIWKMQVQLFNSPMYWTMYLIGVAIQVTLLVVFWKQIWEFIGVVVYAVQEHYNI